MPNIGGIKLSVYDLFYLLIFFFNIIFELVYFSMRAWKLRP